MKKLQILAAISMLGLAAQANAVQLNFTGTFSSYKLVGIAIPLTGVNTTLASWPVYDTDLTAPGFQNTTFNVSGTIDVTGGVVTGAVINQTSPLLVDTAGATGYTTANYNGISWTYSGGTTLPLTPGNGPNVTGTCTIVVPAGSGQCALQLANLQAGAAISTWNWLAIAPNFLVSDLFGGSGLVNVDVGGAGGHPGVVWTVSGNTFTARVTQGIPNANPTLFSAYQGVFTLVATGDADIDGVPDATDNCRLVANASQVDSNADGYGNRCDGDLNNNNATNAQDTTLYRQQLGKPSVPPTYNAADINGNGTVNAQDTTLFRTLVGAPPGPSGYACAGTIPCP